MLCLLALNAHSAKIVELQINGTIGPALADYIVRGIERSQDADLILVRVDTPGGLSESTRTIVQQFLNSKVPIITYVSPKGARAASAGTFLLYASTLAAMAPGTQLGAASPVNLASGDSAQNSDTRLDKKIMNDAIASIRTLAQLRGRNPEFAEQAVRDGVTMTSTEALKAEVINYIAINDMDLLQQLHGTEVVQNNIKIKINTENPTIQHVTPGWRSSFLSVITNPTIAYLLLLIGVYGIFFEFINPGFVLPGVIGAVALLLALYALQLLPVNYAGLGLIILGVMFVIAEGFTPSFGVLGMGGTVAFILGSIFLMDRNEASYDIAWSAIAAMALFNVLFFFMISNLFYNSRKTKVRNGLVMLVDAQGRALGDINGQGQAVIRGEIWSVHSKRPISADKKIKVIKTNGLLLEVEEDDASGS